MVRENYELTRTDSICPSPEDLLLKCVKENDTNGVRNLILNNGKGILNHVYDYPYCRPILHVACLNFADTIEENTITTLAALGADLFFSQESDDHKQALHLAAESTNPRVLRAVIGCLKRNSKDAVNNVDGNGNTALHVLVKSGDQSSPEFVRCAEILVGNGVDVNAGDGRNHSAVLLAARDNLRDLVKYLVGLRNVDLDTHKIRGKSARDWILKNQITELSEKNESLQNNNLSGKDFLFTCLKENRIDDFMSFANVVEYVDADDDSNSLLQLACKKGATKIVEFLLNNGADPNHISPITIKTPLEITSESGFADIFELLLNNPKTKVSEEVICNILKNINCTKIGNIDFERCFQLLKRRLKSLNMNYKDSLANTPLHYAVMYGEPEVVLEMLESGASLASKNKFDVLPVHDIDAKVLEKHLDNCIQASKVNMPQNKEEFIVSFNYKSLIPPQQETGKEIDSDVEKNPLRDVKKLVREMEVISYISESTELKHLLTHPVISSFLFLKWYRVCWFFYTNLAFYLCFCLSLILYVLFFYSKDVTDNPSSTIALILLSILCVTSVILILREIFQIIVSPKSYFFSFENWIELCLIFLTFAIIFETSHGEDTRKQLSAFAVLLSTFELVLLVGQHPKICTNVVILRTVSFNFFKFLLWFSILLIAFAFSFYVLFNSQDNKTKNNTTETEEQDFFNDPAMSMIKTIVMLTGEFDASSINFQTFPLASRLIFLMFVFMITIILFNLLNGLAVSDTSMIKSNAELVGLIARAQHISYIENMILGNLLPSMMFGVADRVCCCFPRLQSRFKMPKSIAEKVCLFPNFLHNYTLQFYPNRFGEVILDTNPSNCCASLNKIYLDKKTVRRTNIILQERKNSDLENNSESLYKMYVDLRKQFEESTNIILQKLEILNYKLPNNED